MDKGNQLYVLDPSDPVARRVSEERLSNVFNRAYDWCPGSKKVIVNAVPKTRPPVPERPKVPSSPSIQSAAGQF